ncbi:MAG: hypothetical protein MUC49_13385 [Raineya sp.]|jgi:hypothetical protein|nr:hypothetical protein [Raineya sp.]
MQTKFINPKMLVHKGNECITLEKIQYSCGIIKVESISSSDDIDSDDLLEEGEMFIEQATNHIPLVKDQIFGIEFGIITSNAIEKGFFCNLSYIIKRPDKHKKEAFVTTQDSFTYKINTYHLIWQKLDTEDEMVLGDWIIEILDNETNNTLLIEKFDLFHA